MQDISAEFYDIDVTEPHVNTESIALKHCRELEKWVTFHKIPAYTVDAFEEAKNFVRNFYGSSHKGYIFIRI
jgi:tRNA splicing ligase